MNAQLIKEICDNNTFEVIAMIENGYFNNELYNCPMGPYTIIGWIVECYFDDKINANLIFDALFTSPTFDPGCVYASGSDTNPEIITPLVDACWSKNDDICVRLLKTGRANPEYTHKYCGESILQIAMANALYKTVYILISNNIENVERAFQNELFAKTFKDCIDRFENVYLNTTSDEICEYEYIYELREIIKMYSK